jgi:hypothetical protein
MKNIRPEINVISFPPVGIIIAAGIVIYSVNGRQFIFQMRKRK